MYNQEKKYYRKAFFTALLMAAALLLPFVITDKGYFVYYGDYNAQQIPFYKECIRAVQSGNLGWNWQTGLGAGFVGSYGAYTLGSPFFWLAAMFPSGWSQYVMAPFLALKIALSSLFAFVYIRRFITKPQAAVIGGLLYAFSGFSLQSIFYNCFHEAILFFPLLLIGLEEAAVNKRRGVFALAAALCALSNGFFFVSECVFLVIYFAVRFCADKGFRMGFGQFLCVVFEFAAGVMLAGILLVPTLCHAADIPLCGQTLSDWDFMFYDNKNLYGAVLQSIFFPPELISRDAMFPVGENRYAGIAAYLPLFSMAGVFAFIKGRKKHWASVLLMVCLLCAFVPGLNSAFVLFNETYLARWFCMPVLVCCLATAYALEHAELDLKSGLMFCGVSAGVIALFALFSPFEKETENGTVTLPRFLADMSPAVYVTLGLCVLFLAALWLLLKKREQLGSAVFLEKAATFTIICSMALGYYYVGYGRMIGPFVGDYNKNLSAELHIDDIDFYRMEALDSIRNVNMLWDTSSINSAVSIRPASVYELYGLLGESADFDLPMTNYQFRALTRDKYIFFPVDMDEADREATLAELAIYYYKETQGGYDIYTTDYALPMGFAYDSYLTRSEAGDNAAAAMIGSVILTEQQVEKYGDILTHAEPSADYSPEQFKADAHRRIDDGVLQFGISRTGFSAMTVYDSDRLVMFSVPYDAGWSALINGVPAVIEKVNGGFMAIRVPAGVNELEFRYRARGLTLGIILTAAGAALLAAYVLYFALVKREKPNPYKHLYPQNQVDGVKAHGSYIAQLSQQIYDCPELNGKKDTDKLKWPDNGETLSIREETKPAEKPKRTSHLMSSDEAYKVLEELDEKKRRESDNDIF